MCCAFLGFQQLPVQDTLTLDNIHEHKSSKEEAMDQQNFTAAQKNELIMRVRPAAAAYTHASSIHIYVYVCASC